MEVSRDNYYIVQGWMLRELNLKGTELNVFAIINGFSQDGASQYQGGQDYIAEFCGVDIRTIKRVIKSLVDKGYIEQEHTLFGKDIYRVIVVKDKMSPRGDKMSPPWGQNVPSNNINNNINNTSTTTAYAKSDEERIEEWLTNDELYLESNLKNCNIIKESKTSEELKRIAHKFIAAFIKDLKDRGDDLYLKERQEIKRHFHAWLPKSVQRVNEQVDFLTLTKAQANQLKSPHKPVAQVEIQGKTYYTFEDVAIERNLNYCIYHTPAEEWHLEQEKKKQAELEREAGRVAAAAFFAKHNIK